MATIDDFFADWTEERAAEEQVFMRQELAAVDAALMANDKEVLRKFGYLRTEYSDNRLVSAQDQNAILSRDEFNTDKYEQLKAGLALSPQQLADRMSQLPTAKARGLEPDGE